MKLYHPALIILTLLPQLFDTFSQFAPPDQGPPPPPPVAMYAPPPPPVVYGPNGYPVPMQRGYAIHSHHSTHHAKRIEK